MTVNLASTILPMPPKMRAIIKPSPGPGLVMTEAPVPVPGVNDVLIKVKRTSICGTDLHIYNWDAWAQRDPQAAGHHRARIRRHRRGRRRGGAWLHDRAARDRRRPHRVRSLPQLPRGPAAPVPEYGRHRREPRRRVFADYVLVPASNVWKVPADMSLDVISCFDPLGNAVHTALSFDLIGEDVLITGAGPIELHGHRGRTACRGAQDRHHRHQRQPAGAREKIRSDPHGERGDRKSHRRLAQGARDDRGLRRRARDVGQRPAALNQMIDNMVMGGRIALLGVHPGEARVDWNKIVFKMLHLKGIYGREMFETWYKMTALVQGGMDITPVITHRFPVTQFHREGFELMGAR